MFPSKNVRPMLYFRHADFIYRACSISDNSLLVRSTGDIAALLPPMILEKAHVDETIGRIAELVEAAA